MLGVVSVEEEQGLQAVAEAPILLLFLLRTRHSTLVSCLPGLLHLQQPLLQPRTDAPHPLAQYLRGSSRGGGAGTGVVSGDLEVAEE